MTRKTKQATAQKRQPENIWKKRKLPPNPYGENDKLAAAAKQAVTAFRKAMSTDPEDVVCDLLADLMHLCDRDDRLGEFDVGLERARQHYGEETKSI